MNPGENKTEMSVIENIKKIVIDVFEIDDQELTPKGDFVDEYDADSLAALELLFRIDRELNVKIPENVIPEINCLDDLIAAYRQAETPK